MSKADIPTPIEEVLNEWVSKYGLTPAEREVLYSTCEGVYTLAALAKLRDTTPSTVKTQCRDIILKTGDKRITHAALRVSREALRLATFDRERRDAKGASAREDDDHG